MKKIMTLACSALLALGLCACDDTEVEEVPGGDDGTTETVPDTKTDDTTIHPGYVICGDLAGTTSWNNEPDKTSDFYLSTANGETHWERTITGLAEDNGYCGFRVLTYGEWDSVCGASELTSDSTGVSTGSNDILITDGVTYDLVIDISDTAKSIKVTEVVDVEPTSGYEITYAEEQTAVSAADSKMYYWVDEGENHVDPVDGENYYDDGVYHIAYTVEEGVTPLWYGVQLFMELSAEDKAVANLTTGDEYTVSFTISSTVSGSITVNGNEVAIEAGETTVNVKSTTTIEQDASYWADYGYTDENDQEVGEWIETTAATLRVQLGVDPETFLGAATLAISDLTFEKYVVSGEGVDFYTLQLGEAATLQADGLMYYWAGQYDWGANTNITVNEARYYYATDTYVGDYSSTPGSTPVAWAFQFLMQPSAENLSTWGITLGDYVKLSMTLTSSIAGSVKINGREVVIAEANVPQEVTLEFTSSSTGTFFEFDAGYTTYLGDARIEITGLKFEHAEMPSEYDNDYEVVWTDTTLHEQEGEYWASSTTQSSETGGPGTLERWAGKAEWSAGADVTVTDESLTESGYTAKYSTTSEAVWYAYQLFYTIPTANAIPSGSEFFVEMKITVSADINVTINDVVVSLTAGGENDVTVKSGHTKGTQHTYSWDGDHTYELCDLEFQAGVASENSEKITVTQLELSISSLSFHWNNAA